MSNDRFLKVTLNSVPLAAAVLTLHLPPTEEHFCEVVNQEPSCRDVSMLPWDRHSLPVFSVLFPKVFS